MREVEEGRSPPVERRGRYKAFNTSPHERVIISKVTTNLEETLDLGERGNDAEGQFTFRPCWEGGLRRGRGMNWRF